MEWRRVFVAVVGFILFNQTGQTGTGPGISTACSAGAHRTADSVVCDGTDLVRPMMVTAQSSTWPGKPPNQVPHSSRRAINGNVSECAHTQEEVESWWRIDLRGLFEVSHIYINNEHNKFNLSSSHVYIGNSTEGNGTVNTLCINITHTLQNETQNLTCQSPIWGRYVSINLKERQFLVLCEVKIYGTKKGRWKLVKESKTWDEALYYCRERDMDLVSIHDANTQAFVGLESLNAKTSHVWLGLHYTCTLGFWFWVSDHPLNVSYWDSDHRSQTGACDTSTAMARTEPHNWSAKSDYEAFNFICE